MKPAPQAAPIDPLTPHLYVPDARRPIRAKLQHLCTDTRVVPHSHPWAQLAVSATGVVRLTVAPTSFRRRARCGFRRAWSTRSRWLKAPTC